MTQSLRPSKQPLTLSTSEKWKHWLNSWKPSSIKKMWNEELAKVGYKTSKVQHQIDKIMR